MKKNLYMRLINRLFLLAILLLALINITFAKSPDLILQNVPFSSQAPFGNWSDPKFQDGCEETVSIMAMKWTRGEIMTKTEAEKIILDMANWEDKFYHNYHDTSAVDTAARLISRYIGYKRYAVKNISIIENIINELKKGHIIIVPTNGQKLKNPNYKQPGPERHNLLIKGYDFIKKEFITNDPGTRKGESYRYPETILWSAIRDYPTGNHLPIIGDKKVMIVVWK
jgi:hypothetical protein